VPLGIIFAKYHLQETKTRNKTPGRRDQNQQRERGATQPCGMDRRMKMLFLDEPLMGGETMSRCEAWANDYRDCKQQLEEIEQDPNSNPVHIGQIKKRLSFLDYLLRKICGH
jgi:hypothetical protein